MALNDTSNFIMKAGTSPQRASQLRGSSTPDTVMLGNTGKMDFLIQTLYLSSNAFLMSIPQQF